jgi:predicted HTH transcriptional regulator
MYAMSYNRELRLERDTLSHANETEETEDAIEATILVLVADNGRIKQSKMVREAGMHRSTTTRKTKLLKDSGRFERIGSRRDGYWRIPS